MFNAATAKAFRFTEDDLVQNKNGKISERQKAVTRRGGKIACMALLLLGLFIALGIYYANKDKNDTALLRAVIVFSVFAAIGIYFSIRAYYVASGSAVKKASGNILVFFKRKTGNCLVIDNISFPISGTPVENLFKAEKKYTVYYIGTTTLLSIDEL